MFKRARQFFEDVKTEFKRVQWPTLRSHGPFNPVVLSVSLVIAVYLGIADQILANMRVIIIGGLEENQELESISRKGKSPKRTQKNRSKRKLLPKETQEPNAKWYILAYTGYETRVEQTIRKLKIRVLRNWLKKSSSSEDIVEPRVVRNERSIRNIFQDTF